MEKSGKLVALKLELSLKAVGTFSVLNFSSSPCESAPERNVLGSAQEEENRSCT